MPAVEFPSSHWSTVIALKESDDEQYRVLVGDFLTRYYDAMESYLWTELHIRDAHDRADILQSFVVDKLICDKIVSRAEESRGKLRNYIKRCLKNYAIDRFRRRSTKRIEVNGAALQMVEDAATEPDRRCVFEVQWAQKVVQEALDLFQKKYEDKDPKLWKIFSGRVLSPITEGSEPVGVDVLSEQLDLGPKQVHNKLLNARRALLLYSSA